MVVRRPESVFGDQPSRWENHKIERCLARIVGLDGQHGEDGGVRVVERDRAHRVEPIEVVLEGHVVAVPCDDVEGTAVLCALERVTHEAIHDRPSVCCLLVGSHRHLKVSLVSQAIGADGTQVWDLEVPREALSEPASRLLAPLHIDREEHTSRHDYDLFGLYAQ